jgi:hypothetical protein
MRRDGSAEAGGLIGRTRERGIVQELLDRLPTQGGALIVRGRPASASRLSLPKPPDWRGLRVFGS